MWTFLQIDGMGKQTKKLNIVNPTKERKEKDSKENHRIKRRNKQRRQGTRHVGDDINSFNFLKHNIQKHRFED